MTETIGKVTLNLDKYPGEDYYCDGSVEDEILEIVKKYSTVEYDRIIAERKEWPVLYHLSALRENIVDFLPMKKRIRCWRSAADAEPLREHCRKKQAG